MNNNTAPGAANPAAEAQNRKTILVLDDSDTDRLLLTTILEDDYNVLEAANGELGLSILRQRRDIDIVLTDIQMPLMDGFAVLHEMSLDRRLARIPVIVITASDDHQTRSRAMNFGAVDILTKPYSPELTLHRIRNLLEVISRRENETVLLQRQIEMQQEYDRLTGMLNRHGFYLRAEQRLADDADTQYLLIRIDLDHFKAFNDVYGRLAGDRLLIDAGHALSAFCGEIICARHDADHFVILMPADRFEGYGFYDRVTGWLREYPTDFHLVASMGVFEIIDRNLDVSLMCDRALMALRTIKSSSREKLALYDDSLRRSLLEEQELTGEMDYALENGQFEVWFQPQIDYYANRVSGAEALVRWRTPERGMLSPGIFIPLFEKNGFISRLDEFVWEQACRTLRRLRDVSRSWDDLSISVNISRVDVYDPTICTRIKALIDKYDLPARALHLEITESAYMEDSDQLIATVDRLRGMGFEVEMDDFGSGYSSLNMLKEVRVDIMKLDMRFLSAKGSVDEARSGNILASVVRLAHGLGMPVIAEGVETGEQADYLKSIGCQYMQGYHFARPMPVSDFENFLRQWGSAVGDSRRSAPSSAADGAEDFLSASTQTTLLFNSYVGGACIVEYDGRDISALRMNDRFFETIGATRAEYPPTRMSLDRLTPDSRQTVVEMFEESLLTGGEGNCEVCTLPLAEGREPQWIFLRVRCIARKEDSHIFYVSINNCTERHRLAQDNENLSRQLLSIAENIPGGIARYHIRNGHRELEFFSGRLTSLLGYSESELRYYLTHPNDFIHPDDLDATWAAHDRLIADGTPVSIQVRARRSDGEYIWIAIADSIIPAREGCSPAEDGYSHVQYTDINEFKRQELEFERERRESEDLLDSLPGGAAAFDLTPGGGLRCRYISNGLCELFGLSKEEITDGLCSGFDLVYPADRERVAAAVEDMIASKKRSLDIHYRLLHSSGKPVWINLRSFVITNGEMPELHMIFLDMSSATRLYNDIIDDSGVGVCVYAADTGEVFYANRVVARANGFNESECHGLCVCDLYSDALHAHGSRENALSRGEINFAGRHYVCRSVPTVWNRRDAVIVYIDDMTDLLDLQEHAAAVIRNIPVGVAEYTVGEYGRIRRLYLSECAFRTLGYEPGDKAPEDFFSQLMRLSGSERSVIRSMAAAAAEREESFTAEFRVRPDTERERWVSVTADPQELPDGTLHYFAVFTDVTERRRAEELQRSLAADMNDIFMHAPGGFCRWRLDDTPDPEFVSDGCCRLFDCSHEELVEKMSDPSRPLVHPDSRAAFAEFIDALRQTPHTRTGDFVFVRKGGEPRYVRAAFSSFRDDNGVMHGYGQIFDTTELHEAEDTLELQRREFAAGAAQRGRTSRYTLKGRVLELNPGAAAALGVPTVVADAPDALAPRIDGQSLAAWHDLFEQMDRGEPHGTVTFLMHEPNGCGHWLRAEYTGVQSPDGRFVSAVISVEDATALHSTDKLRAFERTGSYHALRALYPLAIAVNLSQNYYCLLEHDSYPTGHAADTGTFDALVEEGVAAAPENEREGFLRAFARGSLLAAFADGRETVTLTGRQTGNDGVVRTAEITALRVDNPYDDDVMVLVLGRTME